MGGGVARIPMSLCAIFPRFIHLILVPGLLAAENCMFSLLHGPFGASNKWGDLDRSLGSGELGWVVEFFHQTFREGT